MKTNKVALLGLFIALAFVLSYIEFLLPFSIGIPGAKIGLANLAVVVALFIIGKKGRSSFIHNKSFISRAYIWQSCYDNVFNSRSSSVIFNDAYWHENKKAFNHRR